MYIWNDFVRKLKNEVLLEKYYYVFQIEKINLHYSRHHNIHNFPMNIIAVLEAYCFFGYNSQK
jgi:hypothetical protein